jgi:hypothetical protein
MYFENVYDESQLWGCHRPLSIIIHISILHDLFWFSYGKNHWLSTCQVSHVMSLFFSSSGNDLFIREHLKILEQL